MFPDFLTNMTDNRTICCHFTVIYFEIIFIHRTRRAAQVKAKQFYHPLLCIDVTFTCEHAGTHPLCGGT